MDLTRIKFEDLILEIIRRLERPDDEQGSHSLPGKLPDDCHFIWSGYDASTAAFCDAFALVRFVDSDGEITSWRKMQRIADAFYGQEGDDVRGRWRDEQD